MTRATPSSGDPSSPMWPVGRVAAMVGVSAITIRSWESRYDMGPSQRTSGQHRRYTSAEVERLRRMQQLIAQGTPTLDAARLSKDFSEQSAKAVRPMSADLGALLSEAESFKVASLARSLDAALAAMGTRDAWLQLIAPILRQLGERFSRAGDCTDIELFFVQAVTDAIERHLDRHRLLRDGDEPVLLVCCPLEKHTLPMTVLNAVLLEHHQPVVQLGPEATTEAVLGCVARVRPRTTVLWSSIRRPRHNQLRGQLIDLVDQVVVAGPGWPAAAQPLSSLDEAVATLTRKPALADR